MRRLIALTVVALFALSGAALAAALGGPKKASVGDSVTGVGTKLKAGRYVLRLAADDTPQRTACVARIGKRTKTVKGRVSIAGAVPKRLTCWENDSVKLGTVKVKAGRYHLVLGVPDGPSGFSARKSFARHALKIVR
jgi:hypothetical protein